MARTLTYENWWGDDGDILVVFGHVDRHELAAAAEQWGRDEWGLWPDDFALTMVPAHAYAAIADDCDPYEPWLYYQTSDTPPPGATVIPITISATGCKIPEVATIPSPLVTLPEPPAPVDPLADRLISRTVHR